MLDQRACGECGTELPANAPQGLCPRCLAGMGLGLLPAEAQPKSDFVIERPGTMIGRYKLLEKIGEGGFGVVYMAEQQEPVQRKVALKIIKAGMDTREVIARFEAERQAIALMDHPNIARALDAGATEAGRPYFVMELVRGIPITDYCDQRNLPTRERLQLFMKVCQAVQHAHQKGVIHRDLKPSNVLVTEHDGEPVPKVIDFGVAKALGQKLTAKTLFTAFNHIIGTPAYMSPEQAALSGLDIDTRADIYSLGVLLYELLTGVTPFDADTFRTAAMDEIRRMIRETEPPKPSTRLETLGEKLADVAKQRGTEPFGLSRLVRGDLDWIVMKCLEKDRQRRYETANGLVMDVARHLKGEVVSARSPSNLYRFQKMVRRHKLAFAAASAVAASLVIGLGVATWSFFREKEARRVAVAARQEADTDRKKAETEARKSQQVAQFLKDMLKGVGPSVALGRDTILLREILDRTAERIGKDLTNQPAVEVELRAILTHTYEELALFKQQEEMARETLRVSRSRLGEEHPAVADALHQIGDARSQLGDQAEAEKFMREAVALKRKVFGNEHPSTAASLNVLAWVVRRQNKFAEAEILGREALAIRKKLFGNEHRDVADSIYLVAMVMASQDKLAESESLHREALAMKRKLLGEEHPAVAESLNNLAGVLLRAGKLAESETMHREALAKRRKLFSPDHPEVAESLRDLVLALESQGKLAELETLYREELATLRKLLGKEHPIVATTLCDLACILVDQGKLPEAEALFREAVAVFEQLVQEDPKSEQYRIELGHSEFHLAKLLRATGRSEQAEQNLREALQVFEQAARDFPAVPYLRQEQALSRRLLADVLSELGRYDESERYYRTAIDLYAALAADVPQNLFYFQEVFHTTQSLAAMSAQAGRPIVVGYQQAIALSEKANEARRKLLGSEHLDVAAALSGMSFLLREQGCLPEAVSTAREALAIRKKLLGNEHADVAQSLHLLEDTEAVKLERERRQDSKSQ